MICRIVGPSTDAQIIQKRIVIPDHTGPVVGFDRGSVHIGCDDTVIIADRNMGPGVERDHDSRIVPIPPRVGIGEGPLEMGIRIETDLVFAFFVDDDLSKVRRSIRVDPGFHCDLIGHFEDRVTTDLNKIINAVEIEGQSIIGSNRCIVDGADRHRGVVVGAGAAVAVGQYKAHGAGTGRGYGRIRVLIGDVLDEGRDCRRRRAGVECDDEIAPAAAAGKGPDGHALIRHVGATHADLARAGALVADAQHVLGAVAAGGEAHGERARTEVDAIRIGHERVAPLLDYHDPVAFVIGQTVAAQIGDGGRVIGFKGPHVSRCTAQDSTLVRRRYGTSRRIDGNASCIKRMDVLTGTCIHREGSQCRIRSKLIGSHRTRKPRVVFDDVETRTRHGSLQITTSSRRTVIRKNRRHDRQRPVKVVGAASRPTGRCIAGNRGISEGRCSSSNVYAAAFKTGCIAADRRILDCHRAGILGNTSAVSPRVSEDR